MARMLGHAGYAIITGGGPGIMEAANRGARDAGVPSVGLGIDLAHEQGVNEWVDVELDFHYFFARKVMFVRYASGFVVYPGGFGTLDELFEAATLRQTEKIRYFPIVLMGSDYWGGLVEWLRDPVLAEGNIEPCRRVGSRGLSTSPGRCSRSSRPSTTGGRGASGMIGAVRLVVGDLDRAVAYYEQVIGLKTLGREGERRPARCRHGAGGARGRPGRPAAPRSQHRPLPPRDPRAGAARARPRAAPRGRLRRALHRRVRPLRQRGALPARPGGQRHRALRRPPARHLGVGERRARHGHGRARRRGPDAHRARRPRPGHAGRHGHRPRASAGRRHPAGRGVLRGRPEPGRHRPQLPGRAVPRRATATTTTSARTPGRAPAPAAAGGRPRAEVVRAEPPRPRRRARRPRPEPHQAPSAAAQPIPSRRRAAPLSRSEPAPGGAAQPIPRRRSWPSRYGLARRWPPRSAIASRSASSVRSTSGRSGRRPRASQASSQAAGAVWPRARLQLLQAASSFSGQAGPPLSRGTRWSSEASRSPGCRGRAHQTQRKPSRSIASRRRSARGRSPTPGTRGPTRRRGVRA